MTLDIRFAPFVQCKNNVSALSDGAVPRTKSGETKPQQSIALPEQAWLLIDELIGKGIYGSSRGEVARNLILDQLKLLARDRLLPPG
ncbi:MAG: hypothetical protein JNM89_04575 [Hyphomicrobiaceae bacterium]|nr:hypothetical protein [Hyphomicrobiaceae bacterium]